MTENEANNKGSDPGLLRVTRSHRTFVSYIDKSREFYAAQGYDTPYQWASNNDAPFTPLAKPLRECRVGLISTTTLVPNGPLEPYTAPSAPAPQKMSTDHLSWHKEATTTDDLGAFLPLDHLHQLASEGFIGSVAPRFAGIPTIYSQRRTHTWAEQIRERFAEDEVDLALLIPL